MKNEQAKFKLDEGLSFDTFSICFIMLMTTLGILFGTKIGQLQRELRIEQQRGDSLENVLRIQKDAVNRHFEECKFQRKLTK